MKNAFTYLLLFCVGLFALVAMAAAPAEEGAQVLYFNAADQETTGTYAITAIAWLSDQGTNLDIAADDDMLLEAGDGSKIIGARAEATADDLVISFPVPIVASGLKAEDLDGGVLYVYGQRR